MTSGANLVGINCQVTENGDPMLSVRCRLPVRRPVGCISSGGGALPTLHRKEPHEFFRRLTACCNAASTVVHRPAPGDDGATASSSLRMNGPYSSTVVVGTS